MDISTKLKSLRIAKKLEPIDMALKIGVSENTYRRYERNEASPDINKLEKIAQALEKNILELLPDNLVFENKNQKGGFAIAQNLGVINSLSEKVIELYEKRLEDKDVII